MRDEGMSPELFSSPTLTHTADCGDSEVRPPSAGWSPESFARQQIQGLVRKVFLSNANPPVRQVVFGAVEAETDVRSICRRAGEALAAEDAGTVGVMGEFPMLLHDTGLEENSNERIRPGGIPPLRRIATRVQGNLWLVPGSSRPDSSRNGFGVTNASLHSYLGELRREFEYSIVEGPADGASNDAIAMAQFADGIILVLSAQHTRRVTARRIKQALESARARLLGTVLVDRVFPIPQGIYRRL
jgi:hypothetical protein